MARSMTNARCIHGIDSRFCANCNRRSPFATPRGAMGSVTLAEILVFLNAEQIRATYGAVGDVLGIPGIGMGAQLGPHSIQASWVVNASTGLPSGYADPDLHPALFSNAEVIASGIELAMRLTAWKAGRARSG